MALNFKNNEGIDFSPIRADYKEGKEYSARYVSLTPNSKESSPLIQEAWGKRLLARDRFSQNIVILNQLKKPTPAITHAIAELTSLHHPHIENVVDLLINGDDASFVTEYHEGFNLYKNRSQITKRRDELYEVAQLTEWIRQLFEAMKFYHQQRRILHGNINPTNLTIKSLNSANDSLIVSGFHQTRIAEENRDSVYQSPQVLAGRPYTLADEIYSLGATLYQLISNQAPPKIDSAGKASIHLQELIEQQGAQHYALPRHWNSILNQCLSSRAKTRPSSIEQIQSLFFGSHSPVFFPATQVEQQAVQSTPDPSEQFRKENEIQIKKLENKLSSEKDTTLRLETEIEQTQQALSRAQAELTDAKANFAAVSNQSDNKDIGRIDELQSRINILKEELDSVTSEKNTFSRESILIRSEVEDLRAKQNAHASELDTKRSTIQTIESQNTELSQELQKLKKGVKPISAPILIALLIALLCGIGASFYLEKTNTADTDYTQLNQSAQDFIPKDIGETSAPVSSALFYQYLKASELTDEAITTLIPSLTTATYSSNEPVTQVPYWMAERFCGWLTQFAQDGEGMANTFVRIPNYPEAQKANIADTTTFPEWTTTQKLAQEDTTQQAVGRLLYSSKGNQETYWQIPHLGVSNQGQPIGFRVILDKIK